MIHESGAGSIPHHSHCYLMPPPLASFPARLANTLPSTVPTFPLCHLYSSYHPPPAHRPCGTIEHAQHNLHNADVVFCARHICYLDLLPSNSTLLGGDKTLDTWNVGMPAAPLAYLCICSASLLSSPLFHNVILVIALLKNR
jgi:hypothetical protein